MRLTGGLAMAAALLLAGCVDVEPVEGTAAAAAAFDVFGPHEVVRREYDFGLALLSLGNREFGLVPQPLEPVVFPSSVNGNVHYPAAGDGPFPLVVFLHGQHQTCGPGLPFGKARADGDEGGSLTCPDLSPAVIPIASYAGYDYLAEALASHGYVVASINANDVNAVNNAGGDVGMTARGQLVLRTLDEFARVNDAPDDGPIGGDLVGRVDLSRVGLMGHSRGGEGVVRAAMLNAAREDGPRHGVRAVFALAPTNFNRFPLGDAAFATLLPYCDGDVKSLHGAIFFDAARYEEADATAPRIQILAMGSNHDWYNTVWTFDDVRYSSTNAADPYCGEKGSGRLSEEDQRRHGLVAMSAFFRHYAGGEADLGPLARGEAPIPAEACPGGVAPCPGILHVSYHPPAADRLVLEDALDAGALRANDLAGASTFSGFARAAWCEPADCPGDATRGVAPQLALAWRGPAAWRLEVPEGSGDARAFDALSLRVGVAAAPAGATDFRVVLVDADGRSASARVSDHSAALFDPPGDAFRQTTLNAARVPLSAFEGVDLARLAAVEVAFDATPTGTVQVADVMLVRAPQA